MDKWQKCPLIENCQQKSAVCNVQLPDETCYWFRWFRALDNSWQTGTPTEEGLYVCRMNTDYAPWLVLDWKNGKWFVNGTTQSFSDDGDVVKWQKIEEKEDADR